MAKEKWPFVSIGLVNYKQKEWVEPIIKSIKSSEYPNYKITFIDNTIPHDGSVGWVKKHHPDIHAFNSPANSGFAGGHNMAIESRKADYYVIHDMDIEHIDLTWLKKMVKKLEDDPKGGMAGGVIVPMHLREKFDEKRIKKILPNDIKVHMVSGSLTVIKAELLEDVGLMDEDYFIYWEETDWMYHTLLRGYNIWYMNIPYYHYSGSSTNLREQSTSHVFNYKKGCWYDDKGNLRVAGFHYYYRNEIMFKLINYGPWRLAKGLALLFARTGYHLTLKFHPEKVRAMWRAWSWVFKNWKTIMKKRKRRQEARKVSDAYIAKLHRDKDRVSGKLDEYFKEMEAELMKERKLERTFYH